MVWHRDVLRVLRDPLVHSSRPDCRHHPADSWVLCSEIFPAKMRGRAMSVATFSIWMGCFVIVQTSPALMRLSPFFFYGACSLATFLFVLLVIPETKGKSLEEIEKSWHRHDG